MSNDFIKNIFKDSHKHMEENFIESYIDIDEENAEMIADHMGFDVYDLYYDGDSFLHKVYYWKDELFMPFVGEPVSKQYLEFMKEKERFEFMKEKFDEIKKQGDWDMLFRLMEKKIIIIMFNRLYHQIPVEKQYDIFVSIYVRSEYGFDVFDKDILSDVFTKREYSSEWKNRMVEFKNKTKNKESIKIFRGEGKQSTHVDKALSWTLNKKTAEFFANRFGDNGTVHKRKIDVDIVLDYIDYRNEQEVLIKI